MKLDGRRSSRRRLLGHRESASVRGAGRTDVAPLVQNDEKPASTSTRLETGAEYVACMIFGARVPDVPDSGDVVGTPGPMPGPEAVHPSPGAGTAPPSCDERRAGAVLGVVDVEPDLFFWAACHVSRVAPIFFDVALRTFTLGSVT